MTHYLRGFFDGDGSYYYHYDYKNNRYRYSFEVVGASLAIIEQIQKYLLSKDIYTNIYTRKSPSSDNIVYRLMTGSKKEMLKIIDLLYSDANIYLNRKYDKIKLNKNKLIRSILNNLNYILHLKNYDNKEILDYFKK